MQPFKEARSQALETVTKICGLGTIATSLILLAMAANDADRSPQPGFATALTAFGLIPQIAGFTNV